MIPAEWVAAGTQRHAGTSLDLQIMRHYGYCWWIAGTTLESETVVPEDAFTAWGLNGNFLTVIPSRQLVLAVVTDPSDAHTSGGEPPFPRQVQRPSRPPRLAQADRAAPAGPLRPEPKEQH